MDFLQGFSVNSSHGLMIPWSGSSTAIAASYQNVSFDTLLDNRFRPISYTE